MTIQRQDNIVLTGFMATGKTTVGREVARRLGRTFVDMDSEIAARAGKSIPHIFAQDGEAAFRRLEAALCEELSEKEGLVVATGGGALVDAANRARMMAGGTIICLTASVDEIVRRACADGPERPLLAVDDPRAEARRLLAQRRAAYAAIPWQIDTSGLSMDEVVSRVVEIAQTTILPVRHPGGEYPIFVGSGMLDCLGGAIRAGGIAEGARIAVVSNPVVAPLYGAQVETALGRVDFEPFACTIPDGEQHKTLDVVRELYGQFLDGGLDRSGVVLSLGGGVTGDVAGFAAATFMRGVAFVQVPTTLLAMVDASVGGKTGVDLPQGKNLAGAFKQPQAVVVDPTVLATLAPEELRSGVAETIKHGVIGAPALLKELEDLQGVLCSWWEEGGAARIARALRVKIDVVEEDPFEKERRAVLNLGHTTGHALEKLSDFTLRHGEAVAIGMVAAARLAVQLERASDRLPARIERALAGWGLPVRCPPFEADGIWEAMAHDKKRRGRALRWILPRAIGEVEIFVDIPPDLVRQVLRDMGAR